MPSIAELKERLASLNRRTNKSNDIWKPKDEHDVRLLRYPHGEDPLIPLHFHYEVGDTTSILCPKVNFGDECVICDLCDQLKAWKDENGVDKAKPDKEADWEIFKKIQPKARVFVAMVERGKEAEGAKFWGITPNQAEALLAECTDGDRLSELDIAADDATRALDVLFGKKAYDIHVSYAKKGEKGNTTNFNQVSFKTKIKASPIMKDAKAEADLMATVKKITDVYPKVSSSEVEKICKKFMGQQATEAKPTGGVAYNEKPAAAAPANTKENAKVSGTRSIDEAFGEMLADD